MQKFKKYIPSSEEEKEIGKICSRIDRARKEILDKKFGNLSSEDNTKLKALRGLKRIVCAGGPGAFFELKQRVENRQRYKTI